MKMKFKEYPKEYEDIYSSERSLKNAPIERMSNTIGLTNFQYATMFHNFGRDMFIRIFDDLVKFVWLNTRFTYNNRGINPNDGVGENYSRSKFATFSRNYIGLDFKAIMLGFFPIKIISYFNDFFPEFNYENPFENPDYYKFPYEHVTPDFLLLVHQMPVRLKILDIAEKRKMTFAKFYDYVVNYVMCYNAEKGQNVYTFKHLEKNCPSYVKYNSKRVKRVTKKNKSVRLTQKQLYRINAGIKG